MSQNIVFQDADIAKAVNCSAWGIKMNFGQTCHAGTRYKSNKISTTKFVTAYTERMSRLEVGDNFDPYVDQRPQNSRMQYDKIPKYIETGKEEGATLHLGDAADAAASSGGYYIQPTIFTDVTPDMTIVKEETFGPVATIGKFKDEEEVVQAANDETYGLA